MELVTGPVLNGVVESFIGGHLEARCHSAGAAAVQAAGRESDSIVLILKLKDQIAG